MKVGMGYMHWTADETLDTPMPLIELAYKGWVESARNTFGVLAGVDPDVNTGNTVSAKDHAGLRSMMKRFMGT